MRIDIQIFEDHSLTVKQETGREFHRQKVQKKKLFEYNVDLAISILKWCNLAATLGLCLNLKYQRQNPIRKIVMKIIIEKA